MVSQNEIRQEIRIKKSGYVHFDKRMSLNDQVWTYITNKEKIKAHGFYPFLHFQQSKFKHQWSDAENGHRRVTEIKKYRDILYAAHVDSWIYRYYGALLNKAYNKFLAETNLDNVPIAYRNNKKGKSNIHFAEEVFAFIKYNKPCYVKVGDFSNFFDFLDHKYLLKQIRTVIGDKRISDDSFHVLKSLLQYSYVEYDAIIKYTGMNHKQLEERQVILPEEDFRSLMRNHRRNGSSDEFFIKKHKANYGIPQGSPMSGVLANIYMIEFDRDISALVSRYHGIYRRYSDDFIIVIPEKYADNDVWNSLDKTISGMFKSKSSDTKKFLVKLSDEKTHSFFVNVDCNIYDSTKHRRVLSFLGFSYDGKRIYIRDSSVHRYYMRAYKKARNIVKQNKKLKGNKRRTTNLYKIYSRVGLKRDRSPNRLISNFPLYSKKAHLVFQKNFPEGNRTGLVNKRHMRKLRKQLKKQR